MSDLTIEKMDKINFLVTEVSLECLGNKFFDVYGNQNSSLLGLISYNSLRKPSTEPESDTALWKSLTAERQQPIIEQRIQSVEKAVSNEPRRKRRASCSITNNEPDTSDDPESLLVPMPVAPKAAKIMQRRSTISVQLAKNRKMTSPIAQRKSRRQAQPTNEDGKATKTASVAEIKQNLKKDTNLRKCFLILISLRNMFWTNCECRMW